MEEPESQPESPESAEDDEEEGSGDTGTEEDEDVPLEDGGASVPTDGMDRTGRRSPYPRDPGVEITPGEYPPLLAPQIAGRKHGKPYVKVKVKPSPVSMGTPKYQTHMSSGSVLGTKPSATSSQQLKTNPAKVTRAKYMERIMRGNHTLTENANFLNGFFERYVFTLPEDVVQPEVRKRRTEEMCAWLTQTHFVDIRTSLNELEEQEQVVKNVIQSNKNHNIALRMLVKSISLVIIGYNSYLTQMELWTSSTGRAMMLDALEYLLELSRETLEHSCYLCIPSVELDAALANLSHGITLMRLKARKHTWRVEEVNWCRMMEEKAREWFRQRNAELIEPDPATEPTAPDKKKKKSKSETRDGEDEDQFTPGDMSPDKRVAPDSPDSPLVDSPQEQPVVEPVKEPEEPIPESILEEIPADSEDAASQGSGGSDPPPE